MKALKKFKLLGLLALVGLMLNSCAPEEDFGIPPITFEEPNVEVNSSIASIKQIYEDSGMSKPMLIEGDSLVLAGYVVSSDKAGNFYKELIIQSSPENPEAGIAILTNTSDMYTFFEPGRKVYVKLDGLYIGEDNGVIKIGGLYGDQVGRLSEKEFAEHVLRSKTVKEITPTLVKIGQLDDSHVNTLVKFENVQFVKEELGLTYSDPNSTFGTNRHIISCATEKTIIMRNSGFANFKNQLLPKGNGTLVAVLSKYNDDYQVYIRNTDDVNFDQPRCKALFEEDFEDMDTGYGVWVDLPGWTNVNVNGGSQKYEAREYNGNKYAQLSAFNTGENPLEVWLVTAGIDLSQAEQDLALSFATKDAYNNGQALKVYISTDFTGDPTTATWTELDATIATGSTNGYAESFTSSGSIDISSYAGKTIYIGFQYLGGDGGITTTYQIDNIQVKTK